MTDIDPKLPKYTVRYKLKERRSNKQDDKVELFRTTLGIRDTNNILDFVKESQKTANSEYKHNPNLTKERDTITDINLYKMAEIHVRLTEDQANRLRKDPDVLYVQKERFAYPTAEIVPWGIAKVGATSLNSSLYHTGGVGVRVGVLDSGIDYNHTDLSPNYKGGISTVDGNSSVMDDMTKNNTFHGTHVAGTICAAANNSDVVGVAPKAWLYGIKVLAGPDGAGSLIDIAEGMVWANANNMNVTNNSYNYTVFDQSIQDAMTTLYNNNVFNACSAGNSGKEQVLYPSGNAGAMCVTAVDATNTIAPFATWAPVPYVDFSAPGMAIESDMKGGGTHMLDGTSMATPHVAGLAVLAYANYRLSPCDTNIYPPGQSKLTHIIAAMIASCDTMGKTSPGVQNLVYGFGMPQAQALVDRLNV